MKKNKRRKKCPKCQGSGIYEGYNGYDHKCDHCNGTGRLPMHKKKKIVIKAYMDYNFVSEFLYEEVYFHRPTTRHTNPDVKSVKAKIIVEI